MVAQLGVVGADVTASEFAVVLQFAQAGHGSTCSGLLPVRVRLWFPRCPGT